MSKSKRASVRRKKLQSQAKENQRQIDREDVIKGLSQIGVELRERFIELIILVAIEHLIAAKNGASDSYFDDGIEFLRNHLESNFRGMILKDSDGIRLIREDLKNPKRKSIAGSLMTSDLK